MPDQARIDSKLSETMEQLQNFMSIGIALSAERDRNKLLETILAEARRISNADAGTLYMIEGQHLKIKIIQNEKLKICSGGKGEAINLPPVPLKPEYVSGYVALTGESVNIPDIGAPGQFNFSGPREYDKMTGYHTVSMLVIPLKNYFGEVLGVLQLINALDKSLLQVTPFDPMYQTVIEALSSLAAIALTNMKLMKEIEDLFESFVQVMVAAIESRTPFNATHTEKVFQLAYLMAGEINNATTGAFAGVNIDGDHFRQLTMAAWLHDIGKIATPLEIINKATRLGDRFPVILRCFDYALEQLKCDSLERQLELWKTGKNEAALQEKESFLHQKKILEQGKKLVIRVNDPSFVIDQEIMSQLKTMAAMVYRDIDGNLLPLITPEELTCLLITRGTLTDDERKIMEEHVLVTEKMLSKMLFTGKLAPVPQLACMHHEYLNGEGYPYHLESAQIPLEARILAIADIFDALTAGDRPYRKAMLLQEALRVMTGMAKEGKLDQELVELFINRRIWEKATSLPHITRN